MFFTDLMYGYFLQQPSGWTVAAFGGMLFGLLPRKVSAGQEFNKSIQPVLAGFFGFYGAQRLISRIKKVSGKMVELALTRR